MSNKIYRKAGLKMEIFWVSDFGFFLKTGLKVAYNCKKNFVTKALTKHFFFYYIVKASLSLDIKKYCSSIFSADKPPD